MTSIVMIIALTLWGEARGESVEGKLAVASVIWLRAGKDPSRLAVVCRKPKQFSCWNDGAPVPPVSVSPAWEACKAIAQLLAKGRGSFAATVEADHYHATSMKQTPYWAEGMKEVKTIGGHVFYNSGRKW